MNSFTCHVCVHVHVGPVSCHSCWMVYCLIFMCTIVHDNFHMHACYATCSTISVCAWLNDACLGDVCMHILGPEALKGRDTAASRGVCWQPSHRLWRLPSQTWRVLAQTSSLWTPVVLFVTRLWTPCSTIVIVLTGLVIILHVRGHDYIKYHTDEVYWEAVVCIGAQNK